MKIRVVKTASNAKAVQVMRYQKNKRIIMKHIGSSHTKEGVDELKLLAQEWIKSYSSQLSLFPDENPNKLLHLNYCTFLGVRYNFFNKQINSLLDTIGLDDLPVLFKDLVTTRIFEPASKLRSLELMEHYFGIYHSRKTYYRMAPKWIRLKDLTENKVVSFAKEFYSFNYDLLFYDVTTLYFPDLSPSNLVRS